MAKKEIMQDLQDKADALFDSQIEHFQLLSDNYNIYDQAPSGEILFDNCFWITEKVLLSYRKASLSADLDSIAKGERACFLCRSARPAQQESVEWNDYEILVNPYPVDALHFTIVNKDHIPQSLGGRIFDMVRLANALPEQAIFYNGPKCGASAPDHMHFQAVDRESAANFAIKKDYLIPCAKIGETRIFTSLPNMSPFGYFLMCVKSYKDIMPAYNAIISSLSEGNNVSEPPINVVAIDFGNETRVAIIPRKRHRPKCYGTGEGQMLISPASLEMMGRFITSRAEDYERLDEKTMAAIYSEVAYSHEEIAEISKKLSK